MQFHLLSVFWGDTFTDRFGRIALRSLLAPGNLPDLAARHRVVYNIYTTEADANRLNADPQFKEMARHVECRVHAVSLTDAQRRDAMTHWTLWNQGAAAIRGPEDVLITAAPDHLFSRGTMTAWAQLFLDGQVAVMSPGVQVVVETLLEEIERTFPMPVPIDVGIDELHAMMFRHLHPMKIAMLRGNPRSICHPEDHLRPIEGHGFVQNVMGSHAVAFRPAATRVTHNFTPVDHLDRVSFEPCRYLSLEPALKLHWLTLQPWRFDDGQMSQFGQWGDIYVSDPNLRESRTPHVYALGPEMPLPARRRALAGSRLFTAQFHAARAIHRLWRTLRESGHSRAALWIAAAHMHARLRRRLVPRSPATIFIPDEDSLHRLEAGEQTRLLASGGKALIAAIRAHVAGGHYTIARGARLVPSEQGTIRMMDGSRYSIGAVGGVRVSAGPIRVDGFEVYFVRRPLVPLTLNPARLSDTRIVRSMIDESVKWLRLANHAARRQLRRSPRFHAAAVGVRDLVRGRRAPAERRIIDDAPQVRTAEHKIIDAVPQARAVYRQALAHRTSDAIRQMYRFYRDTVLAGTGLPVAPEARFNRQEAPAVRAIELLADAVRLSPQFSEAWLELGFAYLEAGRDAAALDAFEHASQLPPTLPQTSEDTDPRMVAAVERAFLLMRANDLAGALSALEAVPIVWPAPHNFYRLRAGLLVHAGRIDEALKEFGFSMIGYGAQNTFAGLLPGTAAVLDATLEEGVARVE